MNRAERNTMRAATEELDKLTAEVEKLRRSNRALRAVVTRAKRQRDIAVQERDDILSGYGEGLTL